MAIEPEFNTFSIENHLTWFNGFTNLPFNPVFHYLSAKFVRNVFKCYCAVLLHLTSLSLPLIEQISAVRAVVPNKSNNEIVLVLQHFENSVDKAVQAFLEGVTTSVTHFRDRTQVFKAFLLITTYHQTGNVAYCWNPE